MNALNKRARSDEQKLFRRQQIMTAATELFHDVGYDGFSMALLADRAGVVKGTLYLYFKTREEVFWRCTMPVWFAGAMFLSTIRIEPYRT